jgi:7,8-didemethyl-8-hydroxy-5-deazariboflavin synthase CofH subunit/7,8-didemethyl-8-hydroxy-5-deazariboflavin synthase CofG subunit
MAIADLLHVPLDELLTRARAVRDAAHGTRVTYSPKIFIPLTMLCRDRCGYCTFAKAPARLDSPYLGPEEVLAIAHRGAEAGCHEALFTLGERPEERYPLARDWLASHGYGSTIDYLEAMCRLVLEDTGLLPHANAGALFPEELRQLRPVSASQGMMIETLRDDLAAHAGAPDKAPARRLATLEAAGRLRIPFTTGILVGIGEGRADRVRALEAIAASHARHGHVQEVIVQNFLPKPGTAMHRAAPCPADEYLEAIALARLVLPSEVHVQAPPNLSDEFGALLDAGIDDWGGVSPVTADHVNPERPWPAVGRLQAVTEQRGFNLAPRLTVYPEFAQQPDTWLDAGIRFAVLDRSDAHGLGRDDPGAVFPQKVGEYRNVGDGAEVVLVGRRSTQWYSGADVHPPPLLPGRPRAGGAVGEVLAGVRLGQEPGLAELVTLFGARGREVAAVAALADELRAEAVGDAVTWVSNRNINYTNVCTFKCRFCGFSKGPLSLNLRGTPYLLTLDDIASRTREAREVGATEVCLQGGIHPDFDGDYYIEVARAVKDAAPDIHVHAFTALEVTEGARRLGEPLEDYLRRLMDAGLRSLPGTAAEILDDDIRAIICPDKITTEEWLEAHRTAHGVGLRSNITIMFGSVEQPIHWARHLVRTRDLQKETGGFTEFVGLPFVHMAAPIYLQRKARRGPTWREVVLMHAVARIAYRGLVENIQASWVKLGADGARQLLMAGVNDLGGTLINENISRAAGASHGQGLDEAGFRAIVAPLGRRLEQRTTLYGRVSAGLA